MTAFDFSELAESDVSDIWACIASDNIQAADQFLSELEETCQMLAKHPQAGRARPDIDPNVRSFAIGEYLVFYTKRRNRFIVARVLHGRRDIAHLFRR